MFNFNISFDFDALKLHENKNRFLVRMDMRHFHPNEINVSTVKNSVTVQAEHREMRDNGGCYIRQSTRRYNLPKGFKAEDMTSSVSSDGILTVEAIPTAIVRKTRYI